MLLSDSLGINKQGHLTIGGRDTVELAMAPLYMSWMNSSCAKAAAATKIPLKNTIVAGVLLFMRVKPFAARPCAGW